LNADAGEQAGDAVGNGVVDARLNVLRLLSASKQGNGLGFDEHGAGAAHRHRRIGLKREFTQFRQRNLEQTRHHFQEAPGAGGTFVVHREIGHRTIAFNTDRLAILPADINDRAHVRKQEIGALGVAGDFRHRLRRIAGRNAAIARRNNVIDFRTINARVLQCGSQGIEPALF